MKLLFGLIPFYPIWIYFFSTLFKARNSGQAEYIPPEQTEHMITEMSKHLNPEHKHNLINSI